MVAAIYSRKSTEQTGASDQEKSVTRQVDYATAYAAGKGCTVDTDHIYSDDGSSGAEFANRPGFLRLMNALKPIPPFQVLIMSEESRLGREAIETAYALKQLVTAGVRVFFHLEDRESTLDGPTDKIMLSLTAYADELEREKARQQTYDAMVRKAKAGHVTAGRVFGYDNVEILGPSGERGHVERRINEAEAAVVREIFELCAVGEGLKGIAKRLNAAGASTPLAQQGRRSGWAPSSVRKVLHRSLYRGEIVWNRTKKRDAWGQKRRHARPEADWLSIPVEALRIVPEALWRAVHARMTERRSNYDRWKCGEGGVPGGAPCAAAPCKPCPEPRVRAEFPVRVRDVLEPRGLGLTEWPHGHHGGGGRGCAAAPGHRSPAAGRRGSGTDEGAGAPADGRGRIGSTPGPHARPRRGRGRTPQPG